MKTSARSRDQLLVVAFWESVCSNARYGKLGRWKSIASLELSPTP